ncbi:DNA replication and repair protein RecF, partial [Erysipelatoclostridium ramosum]|nr:DNA replication and repair protein RecF [Thomasclavelia ramosa]
ITVRYLSCVPFSDREEELKEALLKKYQKHQERDLLLKQTTAGIHKEDFIFEMNGRELVSFASQGQKRSVLLALKIGMIHMIHEI